MAVNIQHMKCNMYACFFDAFSVVVTIFYLTLESRLIDNILLGCFIGTRPVMSLSSASEATSTDMGLYGRCPTQTTQQNAAHVCTDKEKTSPLFAEINLILFSSLCFVIVFPFPGRQYRGTLVTRKIEYTRNTISTTKTKKYKQCANFCGILSSIYFLINRPFYKSYTCELNNPFMITQYSSPANTPIYTLSHWHRWKAVNIWWFNLAKYAVFLDQQNVHIKGNTATSSQKWTYCLRFVGFFLWFKTLLILSIFS